MIIPSHRLPKTWENLPVGYRFFTSHRDLYVSGDGEAVLDNSLEGDWEESNGTYIFDQERPKRGSYLQVTKLAEGCGVVAFDLPKNWIFTSVAAAIDQELLLPGDRGLPKVVSYSERTTRKKKKPVRKSVVRKKVA